MFPKASRETEPVVYEEIVTLAALTLMHKANAEQKKKLSATVKETFHVNLEFAFHVQAAMKQLADQKKAAAKADAVDAAPQAPPAPQGPEAPEFVPEALTWMYGGENPLGENHAYESSLYDYVPQAAAAVPLGPQGPKGAKGRPAKKSKPSFGGGSGSLDLPDFPGGAKTLQKIRFCVTPLPDESGKEIRGLMCRFVVHDTSIDVGKFVDRVLENAKARNMAYMANVGSKAKTTFKELFPQYTLFHQSQHPAGDMTLQSYFLAIISMSPEMQDAQNGEDSVAEMMNTMNYTDVKSKFHLINVLTTERACARMRDAGVAKRFWENTFVWYDPLAKKCAYPAPTYKYLPEQVFWYHKDNIGLSEQFFPHIDLSTDFLSSLMSGDSIDHFLECTNYGANVPAAAAAAGGGAKRRIASVYERIRVLVETKFVIPRKELLDTNLLSYETNNEFIHRAAEASIMNARVSQECPAHYSATMDRVQKLIKDVGREKWREELETDNELSQKVFECERYNEIRQKSQAACMKVFESLWLTEGNVESLPIPEAIKCMLRWYRDNQDSKFPNVTREFMMWDKELSLFGNSMLRHLNMYSCVAKILQPLICLLSEGLFSCYAYTPRKLKFNFLLHGRYDTGKTFAGITTLLEYTTIKGTVRQYTLSTPAADTTMRHNYDLIVASDEVSAYKVSNDEAKKKPDLVNKEKVKMTDGQIGLESFVYVTLPDGEKVRWSHTVTTDHHISRVECTNSVVEAMNPLASRYFRMTVAQPKQQARKFDAKTIGDFIKSTTVTYLQLNQYLTACICKAEMCGAITPKVEMRLFTDVSNRALDYLNDIGVVQKNIGSRPLEIMLPYATQLVYRMAIHNTFDLPSSPCYLKQFKPSMMKDLQPFLYVTTDIIWWTWTALSNTWFDETIPNVVQAMRKAAKIKDWVSGETTSYKLFERDIRNQIVWKTTLGSKDIEGYEKEDEHVIDINYVSITGSNFMEMCTQVASFTSPSLAATDVYGVFNQLKNLQIPMEAGKCMMPQPQGRFKKWHRFLEFPNPATGFAGRKMVDMEGGHMPLEYRQRVLSAQISRTVDDVPTFDVERSFPAMEVYSDHINFMPGIDEAFKSEKIVEALEYAMLCKTTRPGKVLLGFPEEKDSTQLQVYNLTDKLIEKHITELDSAVGWSLDKATGESVWTGNPDLKTDEERPVPRRKGICFDRRDGLTNVQSKFFNTVPTAPVAVGDTSWKKKMEEDIQRLNKVDEICEDLDYESAKRQHIACGLPLDQPVASPAYIEKCYKEACTEKKREWNAGMDYPHDMLVDMDKRETLWEVRTDTQEQSKQGRSLYKEARYEWNFARDPNMRQEISRRKEKAQGTKRARTSLLNTSASACPPLLNSDDTMPGNFDDNSDDRRTRSRN
ncbi:MAG: hypothetical protein K2Q45_03135 [Nitrosomonas sp.]|nr:hypothetical protein [Nitrosomonas sp.]